MRDNAGFLILKIWSRNCQVRKKEKKKKHPKKFFDFATKIFLYLSTIFFIANEDRSTKPEAAHKATMDLVPDTKDTQMAHYQRSLKEVRKIKISL